MFSRNSTHEPESETTHMFRRVCQVAAPGAKSAVFGCILSCTSRYGTASRTLYSSMMMSTVATITFSTTLACVQITGDRGTSPPEFRVP